MYPPFRDLREAIEAAGREVFWVSDGGVPRCEPYRPGMMNVYAEWEVLMRVECQVCAEKFLCGRSHAFANIWTSGVPEEKWPDYEQYRADPQVAGPWFIGWEDAPWHRYEDRACTGVVMGGLVVGVEELWRKDDMAWVPVKITKALKARFLDTEG